MSISRSAASRVAFSLPWSSGLVRKSRAPSLIASTAVSTVPWAVIKITGRCGSPALSRVSSSRPETSGITTSEITIAGFSRPICASASSPEAARATA